MPTAKSRRAEPADKKRLSRTDWEHAALTVIAEGGVAALSVEALARRLEVTKGSFYWHFADRPALLAGALDRWRARYTERIIELLEKESDPRRRLEFLIVGTDASDTAWRVHAALSASAHEPAVSEALAKVSQERIAYLEACFRALGLTKAQSRDRALLAYTAYIGFLHLKLEGPAELPQGPKRQAYFRSVVEALVPR